IFKEWEKNSYARYMLTEYGLNYINNLKTPEAWLRFAKYHQPAYIRRHLLIPGYDINVKRAYRSYRLWKKQINSAKIIQYAVIKWLHQPGGILMKHAQDQYYQNANKLENLSQSDVYDVRMRREWKLRQRFTDLILQNVTGTIASSILHDKIPLWVIGRFVWGTDRGLK
ncbi:12890_t:CDS:2, partial [Gigaspora rosea]